MSDTASEHDPTTRPFWDAVAEKRFTLQRCTGCLGHQMYPRPFCLVCGSQSLGWTEASGHGEIYSQTTVHVETRRGHVPPFRVAVVSLAEGVRVTANLVGPETRIGDPVRIVWLPDPEPGRHPYAFELHEEAL